MKLIKNIAVADPLDNLASLTVALWVGSGSRHEGAETRGAAHVLEHMVSRTRSSFGNLSDLCESVGGRAKAITTPEFTIYAATLPRDYFMAGWHLLSDQFLNPDLSQNKLEAEKSIIFDEIAEVKSNYGRVIHELSMAALFRNDALGYPARGEAHDIDKLTTANIAAEHQRQITSRIVPIASGGIDLEEVEKAFTQFTTLIPNWKARLPRRGGRAVSVHTDDVREKVPSYRSHVLVSWVLPDRSPDDDFPLSVINRLFGGSPSGVLQTSFSGQEGEYSCYTYRSVFSDCAVLSAYAACSSTSIDRTIKSVLYAFEHACSGVFNDRLALNRAARALNGSLAIGMESTRLRVNWIGRQVLDGVRTVSIPDRLLVSQVSSSAVRDVLTRLSAPQITILEGVGSV